MAGRRRTERTSRARSQIKESNALGYVIVLLHILIRKAYQLFGNMLQAPSQKLPTRAEIRFVGEGDAAKFGAVCGLALA
jgi:hypothetical protein